MALPIAESDELSSHPHRPRVVLAAHLRRLGMTQGDAGKAVGRSERTVRRWEENKALWREARAEALELWSAEMDDASRGRVLSAVRDEGDTHTARWYLERADKSLREPDQPEAGPAIIIAPIHFGFLKEPPEPTYDGSVIIDPETGKGRLVPAPKDKD